MLKVLSSSYLVLKAGKRYSEDLKQCLEPVVRQLDPPLFEDRFVHVLENPQKADQ